MILRARTAYVLRRGMSAVVNDPCDCYYPLPGVVAQNPNLPQCDPATGLAPTCKGQDQPVCAGIAYGAPGYTQCLQAQVPLTQYNAANIEGAVPGSTAAQLASLASLIASVPVPPAAASTTTSKKTTKAAQSNAPGSTSVGTGTAQSNAPGPAAIVPAVVAPGCFGLFGDATCWGPIGSTTALVLGGGLLAAFFLFGGHR